MCNTFFQPLELRQLFATTGLSTTYFDDMNFGGPRTRVESDVNLNRGTSKPAGDPCGKLTRFAGAAWSAQSDRSGHIRRQSHRQPPALDRRESVDR